MVNLLKIENHNDVEALTCIAVTFYVTSSAVCLTAHGPYGACGLEGAPLRAILLASLGRRYPTLSASLEWPYPTLLAALGGGTHRHTHIALYIED